MAGPEIVGLIALSIEGTKICREIYKAINDTKDLPIAFHEVNKWLPLAQNTLEAAQQAVQTPVADGNTQANVGASAGQVIREAVSNCTKKVDDLKAIFRKARDLREDGHSFKRKYRAAVMALNGTNPRVEALMRGILNDVLSLGANQIFRLATQDQMEEIKQAIKALDEVEPSVEDGSQGVGHTFSHSGTGNINTHMGDGDMFDMTKGGTVNKAGTMSFGQSQPPQ